MMKTLLIAAISVAVMAPVAQARFNDREARQACYSAMQARYGAHDFTQVATRRKSAEVYKVAGHAAIRGRRDVGFICETDRNRVTRLDIEGTPGNSRDTDKALAVIAGALVGAAIIGAITNDHSTDNQRPRPQQNRPQGTQYDPSPAIRCFPAKRKCFRIVDMHFHPEWTRREFGRN